MKSIFLADVVKVIHYIIVFFLWFGCLFPKRFLMYHIILIVLVQLQFEVTNSQCILTIWEDSLRGVPSSYDTYNSPFLRGILTTLGINNQNIPDFAIAQLPTLVALSISCIRLFILQ
jgi:hypothetical protein